VPHHAEDYVHRIGRTGRAGLEGRAFTIATPEDRAAVAAIEKLTGHAIPPVPVEGLDPVDWAEDDGRKRGRGRGGAKAPSRGGARDGQGRDSDRRGSAKPRTRRSEAAAEEMPEQTAAVAAEPADPIQAAETAPAARPRSARGGARTPRPRKERSEAPAVLVDHRTPQPDLAPMPALPTPAPAMMRGERGHDRPRRRDGRTEDLGPAVLGFGEEVPAFMRITFRSRAPAAEAAPVETAESEADL